MSGREKVASELSEGFAAMAEPVLEERGPVPLKPGPGHARLLRTDTGKTVTHGQVLQGLLNKEEIQAAVQDGKRPTTVRCDKCRRRYALPPTGRLPSRPLCQICRPSRGKQFNFCVPTDIRRRLWEWVLELNEGRVVCRISERDVLVSLLFLGLRMRPSWAGNGCAKAPNRSTVQVGFRAPPGVYEEFDEWVAELSAGRRVNPVSKNAVILSLVMWGLRNRPWWAGGDPPGFVATADEPSAIEREPATDPPPAPERVAPKIRSAGPPVATLVQVHEPGERYVDREDDRPKRRGR